MSGSVRQGLGAAGERHARRHLEHQGYLFIAANWRCPRGEIDLIMRDADMLVFIEVKTRHGERLGAAEEAITSVKGRRLLMAAQSFLTQHGELAESVWRVDLVAITLSASGSVARLTHYLDAVRAG